MWSCLPVYKLSISTQQLCRYFHVRLKNKSLHFFRDTIGQVTWKCQKLPFDDNSHVFGQITVLMCTLFLLFSNLYLVNHYWLQEFLQNSEVLPLSSVLTKTVHFQFRNDEIQLEEDTPYSYEIFHIVFAMGAMYFAMLFISWELNHPTRK